ncbi:MAG: patatin-like phospholipase family protein [Chlorobiaceae bacterium]|jgi:NTE family protein|nr:patatin-like phospholipase family protein [Chlorobiaceae bacterium]
MEMANSTKERTGLAFGGGVVLGAAHIGVLKAMDELGFRPDCVTGNSIGSFIAAMHAFGKSWQEIEEVVLELDWSDLSCLTLSGYGLLSIRKFGEIVRRQLGSCRIEQSPIPLAIVATDICSGNQVVLREGDVASAVMASSSIPGIFRPVEYGQTLLVDGVLTENVPVSPLKEMGAGTIVCIDLLGRHTFRKPEHLAALLINAFYSAMRVISQIQISEADLVISPDLSRFNLVDMSAVPDLIESGYHEAFPLLDSWMRRPR